MRFYGGMSFAIEVETIGEIEFNIGRNKFQRM